MRKSKLLNALTIFKIHEWSAWHFLVALLVIGSMIGGGHAIYRRYRCLSTPVAVAPAPVITIASTTPSLREIKDILSKNQTITDALSRHGLAPSQIFQLVASTRPVYNLARVAAGHQYWLYLTSTGEFHDFGYKIDDERYLSVSRESENFSPVIKKYDLRVRVEHVAGEIEGSLFATVTEMGERDELAERLAGIFNGDIDFYTDIQPGDDFRILVEKKYLEGSFVKYGSILAASITNQNKTHTGFRFLDENGHENFYAPDGRSLRRSLLKSPLKFARISSRFSFSRFHPILKIFRPHLGVDYAAPVGTPVQAVGAGVVVSAGSSGAGGKMVRLRHSGGFETTYMHLSGIAVRAGSRVDQSQVIGYVGSSGLSTGPHLDFRIYQHGKPVDPRKVIVPPGPPIPKNRFAQFASMRDMLSAQLERPAD